MKPGATILPVQSSDRAAVAPARSPTAAMRPSRTPTEPGDALAPGAVENRCRRARMRSNVMRAQMNTDAGG